MVQSTRVHASAVRVAAGVAGLTDIADGYCAGSGIGGIVGIARIGAGGDGAGWPLLEQTFQWACREAIDCGRQGVSHCGCPVIGFFNPGVLLAVCSPVKAGERPRFRLEETISRFVAGVYCELRFWRFFSQKRLQGRFFRIARFQRFRWEIFRGSAGLG